ncbi:MAG: hypothetical protein R3E87_23180 [Burkholderiaceae bacterium]
MLIAIAGIVQCLFGNDLPGFLYHSDSSLSQPMQVVCLVAAAAWMEVISPDTALSQMNMALHIGADRYFREIGIKAPDELVPPDARRASARIGCAPWMSARQMTGAAGLIALTHA